MPTSPSGVNYEYAPGQSEEYTPTSQTLTLTLTCAWGDRFKLRQDLLGWAVVDPGTQILKRILPMPHPESSALWATGVRLLDTRGVIQDVFGAPAYRLWQGGALTRDGKAYLGVTYQSTLFDVKPDGGVAGEWERMTVRRLRRSVEAQRTPGPSWRWKGSAPAQVLRADLNLPYTLTAVEWAWLALPALPPNRLLCCNRVNSLDFQEFTAGTLLFGPPQEEPVQLPNLTRGWNVTFSAVYRPNGWNWFWKPSKPTGLTGPNGPGFFEVEANDGSRQPFLGYAFQNCWLYTPTPPAVGGF